MKNIKGELERIQNGLDKDRKPPGGWLTVDIESTFADEKAARRGSQDIIDVMKFIIASETEGGLRAESEVKLPKWLLQTFREFSKAELDEMLKTKQWGTEWTRGSWVNSINDRVWQWWSHGVQGNTIVIQLIVDGWPYSI